MSDQSIEAARYDATAGRDEAISPPYVSFNTFRTLLDWLRSEGVPLRFDRSFWQTKFSGSTGTQLVAALRFLGLLEGETPASDLQGLVDATPEERRFILKEILRDSYRAVPFEELDRATPAMVRRWFRAYPIDGHTLRKAVSFFVLAAREAEVSMSTAVRKMARPRTAGTPPRTPARTGGEPLGGRLPDSPKSRSDILPSRPAPESKDAGQASLTWVHLESGGTVTVELALDLFRLSPTDREFVMKLVDLTQSYQERREESSEKRGDPS